MPDLNERLAELRIDRDAEGGGSGRRWWIAGGAAAVVVAAVGAWLLLRPALPTVRTATAVAAAAVGAGPAAVLDASGYVTARLQATISSKVTGKITEVLIEEGDVVAAGDVLARLDSSTVEREVGVAEARLSSAARTVTETQVLLRESRIHHERIRSLVAANAASQADLDAAEAQADSLEARLQRAREDVLVAERLLALRRQDLEDRTIRAPFDGVVVTKNAQPGEMISPVSAGGGFTRTGICTLVDMSSLEIEVDVNEAYINRVRRRQQVVATLDAYPDWKISAAVITPVPTADRQKATVRVRIAFDELDPRILPDMGVKVSFLEADDGAGVAPEGAGVAPEGAGVAPEVAAARSASVPAAAVRGSGDRAVVFVLDADTVERRAVRLGGRRGDQVDVVAGLRAGERVVVEPPDDLQDGARVRTE